MSEFFSTTSPACSTKATRISKARLPSGTGGSPLSSSCRRGQRGNGPNEKVDSTGAFSLFLPSPIVADAKGRSRSPLPPGAIWLTSLRGREDKRDDLLCVASPLMGEVG